jgi:hypothetical protein
MKNDDKIRKYLEGELTSEELKKFEAEINYSPGLKKEIDSYKNTLNQFKRLKNIDVDDSYFVNILPRFRERFIKQKLPKSRPAFVLGSAVVLLISLLAVFLFKNDKSIENENIVVEEISNEGIDSYLNSYNQDFSTFQLTENVPEEYDSLFSSMIMNELDLNGNSGDYLVDVTGGEFYNILGELSNEEIDGIYNTLIDKKIY